METVAILLITHRKVMKGGSVIPWMLVLLWACSKATIDIISPPALITAFQGSLMESTGIEKQINNSYANFGRIPYGAALVR